MNFEVGQGQGADVAFHFNPRFDGWDKVVLNSKQNGSWGNEERNMSMPFRKGSAFELVFMVMTEHFKVRAVGAGPPTHLPLPPSLGAGPPRSSLPPWGRGLPSPLLPPSLSSFLLVCLPAFLPLLPPLSVSFFFFPLSLLPPFSLPPPFFLFFSSFPAY